MCKLRQRGRSYGGPAGSRGIDPSLQLVPKRRQCRRPGGDGTADMVEQAHAERERSPNGTNGPCRAFEIVVPNSPAGERILCGQRSHVDRLGHFTFRREETQ